MSPRLIRLAVDRNATNPPQRSQLHGEEHWKAVAIAGLRLAEQTPGADLEFLLAFAQLHDIMRRNDGYDPEHGKRAADLFRALCEDPGVEGFAPGSRRAVALAYAIAYHSDAHTSAHPNVSVGICWDADRLNLWRVGIEPDPAFLTTAAARSLEARNYGRELCHAQRAGTLPAWDEITRGVPGVGR